MHAGVLSATGQSFQAEHVRVKGPMGEGSYGQVFEVRPGSALLQVAACQLIVSSGTGDRITLSPAQGALTQNGATERVVLKRVKNQVEVRPSCLFSDVMLGALTPLE